MSGKLTSPEITILSNWSQTSCKHYRIHPSNLGLHWVAHSKNSSNFGKNDFKLLQLGFRFTFKFFDSFEGGRFDCDKNSTTTSIRPISPKYCKARMQYFKVADILVQPCLIDAYNVRVFGVHPVLEALEVTHGLPVCCAVFVITFNFLVVITRQLILPAVEAETGPGLGLMAPDIKRRKVASELL